MRFFDKKLFTYSCDKTAKKNISAVDLNPLNPDLLVVSSSGIKVDQPENIAYLSECK